MWVIKISYFLFFFFSGTVCKNKWTTLRNSYSRALRNQKAVKSASRGIPIKKWYLQDNFSFMKNFMRQGRNKRRDSTSSENSCFISNSVNEYEENNDDSFLQSPPSESAETEVPSWKRGKSMTPVERVAAPITQSNDPPPHTVENENPNILFFRSLLPDLDKLSPKRQRAFKSTTFQKLMELLDAEEYEFAGTS